MTRYLKIPATTLALTLLAGASALAAPASASAANDTGQTLPQKTGDYVSDTDITTKVKAELLKEKNLKSLGIHVETTDGVVTLSGEVPQPTQIAQAEDVTRKVKGVKDVHNTLTQKGAK